MAGPTDVLTEDVKDLRESNRQLAGEIKGVFERLSTEMRDSNQRLTDAIGGLSRDFGNFRVEVAKELGAMTARLEKELGSVNANLEKNRVEVTRELGTLNANLEKNRAEVTRELGTLNARLEKHQGETATSLRFVGRGVAVLIPVVIGLIGSAIGITGYAAKLDSRVERVERAIRVGEKPDALKR